MDRRERDLVRRYGRGNERVGRAGKTEDGGGVRGPPDAHRYEVDAWAEVMVQNGSMLFRGRVLDLSLGGCYVETEARLRLAPGTRVEIVFRLGERVFRCEATSRMLRSRGAGFLFEVMNAGTCFGVEGADRRAQGELKKTSSIKWCGRRQSSIRYRCFQRRG